MTGHPVTRRSLSRRNFLKGGLGLGALGALGLTGCSLTGAGNASDLGGTTQLRMLNWVDYIDVTSEDGSSLGTLDRMRSELGLQVAYDESYTDSYDGFQIILDRAVNVENPEFDLVVPVNWRAAQMIESDWVEPIPLELVRNHVNLDPAFMTNSWDRGSRYQMPWQAGITGIAYDPKLTGRALTSINDLFDPKFKGRVGLLGEMREAVGLAMLANGDDPSRPTLAGAEAGLNRVREAIQTGQVKVVSDDFDERLDSGELVATMAWSGDTAVLQGTRPDIEFVIPAEGAIQWFDAMVIPKRAANIAAAGRFMNFVYDPANAALITAYVGYISPVLGVQDVLRASGPDGAALAGSPVLFPDAAARNRLFTWGGLDAETETRLDDEFLRLVP
ncbi:MAG: spermidine/putrescine ABC transporter substrate-binding protein [Acidimicrobiales bacterium]